jgi:5-guanidino-2-oxopentanoate decarboxylase
MKANMSRTIGGYLVELLAANDVDTVFGIPGVHNLELYRALGLAGMKHLLMRHEQGAGFAADGFARASGRVAAAFVISGPGVTNILTAAAQAHSDSIPLLVIASAPVRAAYGKQWGVLHELKDQALLAAGVFGVARRAHSAQDIHDHLKVCLASLRTGRPRPAYLEVPLDLLAESTVLPVARFEQTRLLPHPDPAETDSAVRNLRVAVRPLLIAGGGAIHATAELKRLVETLDCPLITTTAGKGVLPDHHPSNFGASLAYAATRTLIAEADVVLAVGTELAETDLFDATRLELGGLLIRIDVDPVKLADGYAADVRIWSDARAALARINADLHETRTGWCSERGGGGAFRAAIDAGLDAADRARGSALRAIRMALPRDAVVFTDMTQIAYLGNYLYAVDAPGQWFHPSGYGTLGYALPAALGAKFACPARAVVALAGDYGVQFTLNEFMTAVEAGIALPLVVWNNGALGQIRDDMVAAGIAPLDVIARNPDFVALAQAYGGAGVRVQRAAALTDALRAALERKGPTLIDIDAGSFA